METGGNKAAPYANESMVNLTPRLYSYSRVVLIGLCVIFLLVGITILVISAVLIRSGIVADSTSALLILEKITIDHDITVAYMMKRISIGMLVVGVILMLKSFVGIFGAFFRIAAFIVIFLVILVLLAGFQIFVLYIWFKFTDKFDDDYAKLKMLGLLGSYNGTTNDTMTVAWNNMFVWELVGFGSLLLLTRLVINVFPVLLFLMFECCGVNNQSKINDIYLFSPWGMRQTLISTATTQIIPGYCCKGVTAETGILHFGKSCTTNPNKDVAYYHTGCYQKLESYFDSFTAGFLTMGIVFLLVACVALILGVILIYDFAIRKKNPEKEVPLIQEPEPKAVEPQLLPFNPYSTGGYPPYHPLWNPYLSGYPPNHPMWHPNPSGYPPYHPLWHPEISKNLSFQPIWHQRLSVQHPYTPDWFGYYNGLYPPLPKIGYNGPYPYQDRPWFYNSQYYPPYRYSNYYGPYPEYDRFAFYNGRNRYLPITYYPDDDDREVQKTKKKRDHDKQVVIYEDGGYRSAPSRPWGTSPWYSNDYYYGDSQDRYARNRRSSRHYWYPEDIAYD